MKKDMAKQDDKNQMMAKLMTSLDIENDTQKKHIVELEQFVVLLSTALTNDSDPSDSDAAMVKQFANQFNFNLNNINVEKLPKKEAKSLTDKIQNALVRMDLLLKENFELKREIVFERKKYVDL